MAEKITGSVGVEVYPDASGWATKLRAQVLKDAEKVGTEFGKIFGDAARTRIGDGIAKGVEAGARESERAAPKQGEQVAGKFADAFKARLAAALKSLPKVELDADASEAEQRLEEIRAEIKALGDAKIGVDLDAATALAKLEELQERLTELSASDADIRVRVDAGAAAAELAAFREQVRRLDGTDVEINVDVGRFASSFQSRLQEAIRSIPDVQIDGDASGARAELARIRAEMEALSNRKIGVDIDATEAQERLSALQERLRALNASDVDVQVRTDAGAAMAALGAFQAEVDRLDGRTVNVDVDADTGRARAELDSMGASGNIASGRILGLVGAIALIGPALGPLAGIAAAAFSAIALGAAAAASGVGVLVLALAPVIGATQAVMQNQQRANTASAQGASRALALASAQDALRSALRGVTSAQADAATATERANRRVEDAKRRVEDVARTSAAAVTRADRSVVSAEQDLADAQRVSLRAQLDLTQAREEYARDQEDLASRIANGILDERDAQLQLAQAKLDLLKANADPRVSDLERAKASLAVDQAVQGLKDQQTENKRLAEEKAKADRDGVDGSDKVKSAQEALRQANERVTDSEQRLRDAVQARAVAQDEAARDIIAAQRDVTEAQRDAADQQRRSAEAVASAQQAVVNAHRSVEQASVRSASAGGVAMETMRKKLAELAPEGRSFVAFLTDKFIPKVKELGRVAQAGLLPGLTDGLQSLIDAGPEFTQVVSAIASTLGDMARDAGKALTSPFWKDFLRFVRDEFPPVLRTLGTIFGNLARASAGFLRAMAPVNTIVLQGFARLSEKLAGLTNNTDENSPMQRFVRFLLEYGPTVAKAVGDLALALGQIVVSLAPMGVHVATIVAGFAEFVAALPPSVLQGIALGIGAIAIAMAGINFATTFAGFGTVGRVALAVGALAGALVVAYQDFQPFKRAVDAVWQALKDAGAEIRDRAKPYMETLARVVRDNLAPAMERFLDAATPVVTMLIDRFTPAVSVLVNGLLAQMVAQVGTVVGAIDLMSAALEKAGPIMSALAFVVPGLSFAVGDVAGKSSNAATETGRFADAQERATPKAESLAEAQKRVADETKRATEAAFEGRDAEERYEAALDNAAEAVKRNGATLDKHSKQGRENRDALDEVTKSANAQLEQLAKNGAGEDEIQKKYKTSRDSLIKTATQFGMTKADAKKYADQLLLTPKTVTTSISTPGANTAKAQADNVRAAYKDLASQSATTRTTVTSNWERIRDLAKTPIRFLVNTIMGGFATNFNSLSSRIGGPTLPVPRVAFAAGGILPGYTPGRDVHEFFSPTAGFLALSGGEAIMRPEFTRAVGGKAGVDELNRMARSGAPLVELFGGARYAAGGVIDFIKSKAASTWDWVLDKNSDMFRAVTNPAGFLGGVTLPNGGGIFREVASAAGSAIKGALVSKIASLWSTFKGAFDQSGVGGFPPGGGIGMGYDAMVAWIRKYLPGVQITSTYRPNAVTSSGNTSYHALGRAVDMAPSMDTFNKIKASYGTAIRELIYSPAGNAQIKNGSPHYYTGDVRNAHFNHVHWAMRDGGVYPPPIRYDSGGWVPTGVTTMVNGTGRPEPVLTGTQWDSLRQSATGGMRIDNLTIQMPTTAGTLDMLSPTDRKRAARAIHEELVKIKAGQS